MKAYRHILLVTGLLLTLFAFVPQARGEGWEHHDTVPAAEAPDAGVIGDADATAAEEVAAENKAEEAVDVKASSSGTSATPTTGTSPHGAKPTSPYRCR